MWFALSMAAASVVEAQKLDLHHHVEAAKEAGEVIHTVAFGDVIDVKGGSAPAVDRL